MSCRFFVVYPTSILPQFSAIVQGVIFCGRAIDKTLPEVDIGLTGYIKDTYLLYSQAYVCHHRIAE